MVKNKSVYADHWLDLHAESPVAPRKTFIRAIGALHKRHRNAYAFGIGLDLARSIVIRDGLHCRPIHVSKK
jgi:hypothetical protein